jgi:hypothetical protein
MPTLVQPSICVQGESRSKQNFTAGFSPSVLLKLLEKGVFLMTKHTHELRSRECCKHAEHQPRRPIG